MEVYATQLLLYSENARDNISHQVLQLFQVLYHQTLRLRYFDDECVLSVCLSFIYWTEEGMKKEKENSDTN